MSKAKKQAAPTVDPSTIPEVVEFLKVQAELQTWKDANAAWFEALNDLIERFNDARDAADKAVRAQGVSCGPWNVKHTTVRYNADLLQELLGLDAFLTVGGKAETVKKFSVDKARLEAAIATGNLPADLVEQVRTVTPTYSAVKALESL